MHRGYVSKGQFFTYRRSQQTRNQRSKAMLADGMSAAAKMNLKKNEVTDVGMSGLAARERSLHYRPVRCNAFGRLAESAIRCSAKIVSLTKWKAIMREVEPCRYDQCACGWCEGGKSRDLAARASSGFYLFTPDGNFRFSDDSRHGVALALNASAADGPVSDMQRQTSACCFDQESHPPFRKR